MKRLPSNLNNGCRQKKSKQWGQEMVWISFVKIKDKPRLNPKVGTIGFMFKAHILGRATLQVVWLARSPEVTTLNPTRAFIFQRQGILSEGLAIILKLYISSDCLFWNTARAGSGGALDEVTWWPENRFLISKCKFFLTAMAERQNSICILGQVTVHHCCTGLHHCAGHWKSRAVHSQLLCCTLSDVHRDLAPRGRNTWC